MSQSPPPPNPFLNQFNRFLRFARKPKTIVIATTSITLVFIGYTGLNFFLKEYLPPWLEKQLSKVIYRPVEIGELEGFSFTSLQLEDAYIPETTEYSSQLRAKNIKVTFNPVTILLQGKLAVNVSPQKVTVKVREKKPGQWLNVKATDEVIPLNFDLSVNVKNTEIILLPYQSEKTVNIKVTGNIEYEKSKQRKWLYDISLGILESNEIQLQGETFVKSTKSKISLQLNQLPLQAWSSIVPNLPFNLDDSYLKANLNLDLPSLIDLKKTEGQGNLQLEDFQAKAKPLKEPIQADLAFQFEKNKILIDQGKIILGDIITTLQGYYDWQKGSNIKIDFQNFNIDNVLEVIPIKLPIKAEGKFNINLNLTGLITNPIIQGKFINDQLVTIERTPFQAILAEFKITLDKTVLEKFLIEPQAGGQIQAKGSINQNISQLIEQKKPIDLKQFPIDFNLKTALPTQELINTYYTLPSNVNFNLLQAKGELKGKLGDINGLIEWQTSGNFSQENTTIISQGEIVIKQNNLLLKATKIRTAQGIIDITGSGNLTTKKWQSSINTESLSLTPFATLICIEIKLQCPDNLILEQGDMRLSGEINQSFIQSLDVNSNLLLSVDKGKVIINSNINNSQLQTNITTLELPINTFIPNLPVAVSISNSRLNISGNLETIWNNGSLNLSKIDGNGNVVLRIEDSLVTATGKLQNESLETVANINSLSVNQIIPNIPVPVNLVNSDINIQGELRSLTFSNLISNLNNLQITANSDLLIANRSITAQTELNQGQVNINAITTPLSIAPFTIKNYPSLTIRNLKANLTASLSSLLKLNFNDVTGYTNTEIDIGNGTLIVNGDIKNNIIDADITTVNLELSSLNTNLFSNFLTDTINTSINASLPLNSILPSVSLIPINVRQFSLEVGEQNINAQGNLTVSNLWESLDVETISLEVQTNFNLSELPLTQLLDKIPINRQLLPTQLELIGQGDFIGTLLGKNILTAPLSPGNLQIVGDVSLANLGFNEQEFEPELKGKLTIDSLSQISLNIEGRQDKITAVINPCFQENCSLVSVIESFEIRQTYNNNTPIIARVKRNNDNLVANVESLPIDILKIAPLGNYGLPEYLGGIINIDLSFNPSDLNTVGKVTIASPRFGNVVANQFEASLLYKDGLILLEKTQLSLGNSNYNIVGKLYVNSGEVQGKVNIDQGKIQDLLTALQLYNWDSLLRLLRLKKNNFTTAENVKPNDVGNTLNSIAEQLYIFWKNDQKIKEIFAETQVGDLPRKLDIKGQYNAEMILDGTIENPQVAIQFEGNEWTWNPQPSTASIVPSLGLVMEGSQVIPIDRIAIHGQLKNGTVSVNPMIQLGTATASGILNLFYNSGQYSLESSAFKVENLTLDLVRNLIVIPSDVNGSINVKGVLNGTLENPVIDGIFAFHEGVINARSLNLDLGGKFNYSNDKLQVTTNQPEFISVSATLPFPIVKNKNNQFQITAKLGQESFALLQPLTLDQVIWVGGEGNVTANIQGKISIDNQLKISLDSDSQINLNLDNAKFTNNLIPTLITLNGKANIKNRSINVDQLTADVVKTRLNITGDLPLLPLQNQQTVNNPLTIQIRQNEVNNSGIYQGLINGDILITGALIKPQISGNINFSEGQLNVPKLNFKPEETSLILEKWLKTIASEGNIVIPPKLNNFKITLDDITVKNETTRLIPKTIVDLGANFNLSGNLTLNGQINRLSLIDILSIEPSGKIKINSGQVNIPVTRVFISDRNENTLTFLPEQGLLNPLIDLELKLYIFAVALRSIQDNEIPDDIVQSGRAKSAEITLNIEGSADEVLPNINNIVGDVCQFNDQNSPTIENYNKTSPENLRALARCVEVNNLGTNSIADLLRSPIVSFSSNPPLTNTELSTLFSQQLSPVIEELQQQNSSQLLQTGVVQSAVVILPFLQDWVFNTNQQASQFGESIGLTNLRLFPVLETVYKLEDNALIRFSYDYTLNEATIRYENKF